MILELDCGNSFIKWRVISIDAAQRIAAGVVNDDTGLFEALSAVPDLQVEHCRMVSVRSDAETEQLVARLRASLGVEAVCAQSASQVGAVRNGYADFQRLGLDRWLAVLGAYHLGQRACLVVDLGTAVTADFISADGTHLGGFICPGLPLMRDQLSTHTAYSLRPPGGARGIAGAGSWAFHGGGGRAWLRADAAWVRRRAAGTGDGAFSGWLRGVPDGWGRRPGA